MSRVYISAAHKSSGKTTLSIGLCAALTQRGLQVQPFKKGPDYIDPLWLAKASQLEGDNGCHNLDFNTQSSDEILQMTADFSLARDISIIEGNKGLYDGVALDGSDSNAAMAKLTQSPVILVIDSRGVTRGVAPLLLGYQQFDKDINIAGVIYNFSNGGRHEQKIRAVTEAYTDIPVLGVLKKNAFMELDERHLGLMPSNEAQDAQQKIDVIAQQVADSVDLHKVIAIADTAPDLNVYPSLTSAINDKSSKVKIGLCEDSAFGFYYTSDKQALKDAGAELISINTLKDKALSDDLDGLFIGGGFPETHMQALSENESMRESIQQAIENGLPTYAECGGLMYLSESLQWNGQTAKMVGIIPADAVMHEKPRGRGYVKLKETADMLWQPQAEQSESSSIEINAHEFHYSQLENLQAKGKFAYEVMRGVGITGKHDGWVYKNLLANYAHMRHTEQYPWAERFVNFVRSNVKVRINTND